MRRMTLALLVLSACRPGEVAEPEWEDVPGASGIPSPVIVASAGRVIDPSLDGAPELVFSLSLAQRATDVGCAVEVEIYSGSAVWTGLAALPWGAEAAEVRWPGLTDDGAAFPAGEATLYAWSDCEDGSRGSAQLSLAVVRLSPVTVDVGTVAPEDTVPLAFHREDLLTASPSRIDGPELRLSPDDALAQTDSDDGTPRALPELWLDPDQPPWSSREGDAAYNVPAGAVMGATPALKATPPSSALVSGAASPAIPPGVSVSLLAPVEADWYPGLPVTAALSPLEDSVGYEVVSAEWRWSACFPVGDCESVPVPGSRTTEHAIYRLLAPPTLRDGSAAGYADGTPWIGTLSDTLAAVEGTTDEIALMSALRERLNGDRWLLYDPGVSSYSDYSGAYIYWEDITSELSDWLDREQGARLYCHSVSCLLSTLGQTWGADVEQIVLGVSFTTNLTRAAGSEDWRSWGFNSHSVAATIDGELVWDASVDLDGDEAPASEPVTPLAPSAMPLDEYLQLLSPDDIGVVNRGRCFIR